MSTAMPQSKAPVEKKVTWATVGSYLAGVALLALLNTVADDPSLIAGLPDWLEAIVLPLLPGIVTFAAGYFAHHTPRPDLEEGAEQEVIEPHLP